MGRGREHECPSPIFFGTKLKLCDICGTRHDSYQAHVFGGRNVIKPIHSAGKESGAGGASNAASNKVTASNNASNRFEDATNGNSGGAVGASAGSPKTSSDRVPAVGSRGGEDGGRKQRWSRESYNAYQREYMRRRRGVASG